jgi:hypothetical protein
MNNPVRIAVAAAAVLAIALVGIYLLPRQIGVAGPSPTPSPAPTASPVALPVGGPLEAGAYVIDDQFPVRVTFNIARPGWFPCEDGPLELGVCAPAIGGLSFVIVENVVADPCDPSHAPLDPPVGPSVDDLVTAISNLNGFEATQAVDITIDGFRGKRFELTAPDTLGSCALGTWSTAARTNGVGVGEVNIVHILDVDGTRLLMGGAYLPTATTPDELAELQRVIDSVHLAP